MTEPLPTKHVEEMVIAIFGAVAPMSPTYADMLGAIEAVLVSTFCTMGLPSSEETIEEFDDWCARARKTLIDTAGSDGEESRN